MLPDELYSLMLQTGNSIESSVPKIRYARVIMKLEQVLQGDFFNEYIKRGMFSRDSPTNLLPISSSMTDLSGRQYSYDLRRRSDGREHLLDQAG